MENITFGTINDIIDETLPNENSGNIEELNHIRTFYTQQARILYDKAKTIGKKIADIEYENSGAERFVGKYITCETAQNTHYAFVEKITNIGYGIRIIGANFFFPEDTDDMVLSNNSSIDVPNGRVSSIHEISKKEFISLYTKFLNDFFKQTKR